MPTRHLVTGGAGFLGSHLVDRLMKAGGYVYCLDDFSTGRIDNISHWFSDSGFTLISHDVVEPLSLDVDRIWHLACPASPIHYQKNPVKTSRTCFLGTFNMLDLAQRSGARLLLSSSSEVYGNPIVHPQPETYEGSVNIIGPRACYNEGKRIAETLCFDFQRFYGTQIRVARIFNTYGPRMLPDDGRVVSNFIVQALRNHPLTLYGDATQTRSFCYVDDLVDGLISLMESNYACPINLGNPIEYSIRDLAKFISSRVNSDLPLIFQPLPPDDPCQRQPDISLAQQVLSWSPSVTLDDGLQVTIEWFRSHLY